MPIRKGVWSTRFVCRWIIPVLIVFIGFGLSLMFLVPMFATDLSIENYQRVALSFKIYGFLFLGMGVTLFLFPRLANYMAASLTEMLMEIRPDVKHWFNGIDQAEKRQVMFLILALTIYRGGYLVCLPISFDEAWTYLHFSLNGFIVSLSHYAAPNNHVLNSILTVFSCKLPIDPVVALRLPAFIIGSAMFPMFYLLIRQMTGAFVSILLSVVFNMAFYPFIYGLQARGYGIMMLCVIVLLLTSYGFVKNPRSWHLFVFIFASLVGYAALPSFLYFHAVFTLAMAAILLMRSKLLWLVKLCLSNVLLVVGVLLFYMPIILNSGFSVMSSNGFVVERPRSEILLNLFDHLVEVYSSLFGTAWVVPVAVLVGVVLILRKQQRRMVGLLLAIVLLSVLTPVLHGVFAFSRTWIFLIVPVFLLFGIGFQQFLRSSYGNWITIGLITLIAIPLHIRLHQRIAHVEKYSFEAEKAFEILMSDSTETVFINTFFVDANMRFYQRVCNNCLAQTTMEPYDNMTAKEVAERKDRYIVLDADIVLPTETHDQLMHGVFVNVFRKK